MIHGFPIIHDKTLDLMTVNVQRRTHRRKRLNKKWAKRYGFVTLPASYVAIVNPPMVKETSILCNTRGREAIEKEVSERNAKII